MEEGTATRYEVYGLCIESTFPLSAPPAPSSAAADLVLTVRSVATLESDRPVIYAPKSVHGDDAVRVSRGPDARSPERESPTSATYYLHFPERAGFVVALGAGRIEAHVPPDVEPRTLGHLVLDQVLPRWLAAKGRLVLHASAVAAPGGSVAFLGESGMGKSSTALAMTRAGCPLLSDDVVALDGELRPVAGHGRVRATDEAFSRFGAADLDPTYDLGSGKYVLHLGAPAAPPPPLKAVFLLQRSSDVDRIEVLPCTGVDAMLALTEHSFHLDPTDPAELAAAFDLRARLVAERRVWTLRYPSGYERAAAVSTEILRWRSEVLV